MSAGGFYCEPDMDDDPMDIDAPDANVEDRCNDCGRAVPQRNMELHRLRRCGGPPARGGGGAGAGTDDAAATLATRTDVPEADSPPHKKTRAVEIERVSSSSDGSRGGASPSDQHRPRRPRHRCPPTQVAPDEGSDDEAVETVEIVDLSDDGPSTGAAAMAAAHDLTHDVDGDEEETAATDEWDCPKCTLLNPNSRPTCEACHYRNPHHILAQSPSPLSLVGGGALFGGIVGAAGSWMQGRDPLRGALEGGTVGGVSGAFLHEALRTTPPPAARATRVFTSVGDTGGAGNNVAAARSSAATGMPSYPNMGGGGRRTARRSFRVVVTANPRDGTQVAVVNEGNRSTRISRRSDAAGAEEYDPMLDYLLNAQLLRHSFAGRDGGFGGATFGGPNIDAMSHEELLAAFGDGTENMGANEGQIGRLPTRVIRDPENELPEDARQCMICLEDFERADTRMVLPCLHGFHEGCATRWLLSNGCCPVCKHRV